MQSSRRRPPHPINGDNDTVTDLTNKILNPQYKQIIKDSGIAALYESHRRIEILPHEGTTKTAFNKLLKQVIIEPAKRRDKDGFKNINSREIKFKVWRYLADSTYDVEFTDAQIADAAKHIWQRFDTEYNFKQNRQRYPMLQQRVAEWLAGLPLGIDYTYHDIIERSKAWHDMDFTEEQAGKICENWFKFLAFKLVQMWQYYDVDPHTSSTETN